MDCACSVFDFLARSIKLDAVMIFDGGVDGLFYGNEYNTGTSSMDTISIIDGSLASVSKRYYGFTAFGSEGSNYEVRHADALMRIAELVRVKTQVTPVWISPHHRVGLERIA